MAAYFQPARKVHLRVHFALDSFSLLPGFLP